MKEKEPRRLPLPVHDICVGKRRELDPAQDAREACAEPYEVRWSPDQPCIRKPLAAYHAARREFFEEVAAVVGGGVLILDADLKKICGHEIIVPPTQH
jgi:hypothetical protein